jgi:bacillithiol biosynthesis cysteine-adding enzyme BshC
VRRAVAGVLREQSRRFGADGATERNLDRLTAGAVAVVTGQQVGLFTGPAYSFYKALTACRLADELTKRGIEAVPVFWLATEDHDLAEVNHCYWRTGEGLARLELPAHEDSAGRRVGEIRLGEAIAALLGSASSALAGPASDEVARALEQSYGPQETLGSAFARLMARMFAGRGIILLDSLDPRLHQLARGVYRRALEQCGAITKELLARSKALERQGYHAQVKVTERSTLLFLNVDGRRQSLRQRNGGFTAVGQHFSVVELNETLDQSPEAFSANVLMRPVVQDALLPTAAYVGGPAEVAYFAQAEVVYRRLGAPMPAIVPRAGFTLVEPEAARLLERYGLEVAALFRGRQYVRAQMERRFLPKGLLRKFDQDERSLRKLLGGLRRPVGKLDRTLPGALDTAERKMLYQFLKLRGKVGRSENFRTGLLDRHERLLLDSLYPHRDLQERTHNLLPFIARHGFELLRELERRSASLAGNHQVVFL